MKILGRILLIIVICLIVVAVGAYFYVDTLAKNGITYASTKATGVETTLDSAHVGVFSGELTLDELNIHNPEGFQADNFLSLGNGDVQVTLGSLLSDTVVIPRLHLEDVGMSLEFAGGQANYQVILDNLEKLSGSSPKPQPKSEEPGKGFKIQDAQVNGVTVQIHAQIPGVQAIDKTVKIGNIDLGEIGTDTEGGVALSRVAGIVIQKIVAAVLDQYGDELPTQMLTDLTTQLSEVGSLQEGVGVIVNSATEQAGKRLGKEASDAADQASEKVSEGAKQATDKVKQGIGNLLGGNKDSDDDADRGDGDN